MISVVGNLDINYIYFSSLSFASCLTLTVTITVRPIHQNHLEEIEETNNSQILICYFRSAFAPLMILTADVLTTTSQLRMAALNGMTIN